MSKECELCGKSKDDAEELREHQGFVKCHRCITEYEKGMEGSVESKGKDEFSKDSWKEKIAA